MDVPEGVLPDADQGQWCCHLLMSLYGLKQAMANFVALFHKVLTNLGYMQSGIDSCLYYHPKYRSYIGCYVDDGHMVTTDAKRFQEFISELKQHLDVSAIQEELDWSLGMELLRDREQGRDGGQLDQA